MTKKKMLGPTMLFLKFGTKLSIYLFFRKLGRLLDGILTKDWWCWLFGTRVIMKQMQNCYKLVAVLSRGKICYDYTKYNRIMQLRLTPICFKDVISLLFKQCFFKRFKDSRVLLAVWQWWIWLVGDKIKNLQLYCIKEKNNCLLLRSLIIKFNGT